MHSVNYFANNDVTLLESGTALFPAMVAAIDAAEIDVYFETYIFADDEAGRYVADALVRAAARGVKVRVVIDWFGTGNRRAEELKQLFGAACVHLRVFNAWFRRGVTRTHRKITVVDHAIAFVGGININDDWFCDYDATKRLPAPRWDFAVQVTGPLAEVIHREAQVQWARVGHLALRTRFDLFRELRKPAHAHGDKPMLAGLVLRDNLRNRRTIQAAYLQAIGRAKKSVLMANPYFAPGHKFRKALALAAERGVEVKLLIGVGEFRLQDAVAHSFYEALIASGVQVIEYQKTQLHAKVAVIDDDWATVGSSNCDGLSLFLNQEANVVVRDAAFARSVRAHIMLGIADGVPVGRNDMAQLHWARRLYYGLAYHAYRLTMRVFALGYA